jgi:FMN phosphatase YigB (HAD superfamily)
LLATLMGLLDALPFARFVYPHVLETLRYLATLGAVGILSDGDEVFQRMKIERSGLAAAVDGHVLIYAHKEQHLSEVAAAQPAEQRVLIDDKARILADVKAILGARVTTVHVLQGHYAREPLPPGFQPDIAVAAIGDLRGFGPDRFR